MKKNYGPRQGKGNQGNSKPPLTHFLCVPLINQTSISQLADSLAEFKSLIPLVPPPGPAAGHVPDTPLVPYGALRPLGTLHFTLGVMSLTTQERLDDALAFLQSLDLASIMQEATLEVKSRQTSLQGYDLGETSLTEPLTIDLVSLHALPRARSATILHASPLDITGRLYPFCVKLREKFMDAGFMHRDMMRVNPPNKGAASIESSRNGEGSRGDDTNSRQEDDTAGNRGLSNAQNPNATAQTERPRPLLLHATIANTIYLGKRRSPPQKGNKGERDKGKSVFTFDATELLEMFGGNQHHQQSRPHGKAVSRNMKDKEPQTANEPFKWAQNIPINRLCICEMGAKPVPNEANYGPVLGQEYKIIGERSLSFSSK
ncbi:uncharacterized protein GIQ15_04070 [Arthroderma uncinatum]|uniref:uncharacterized protein n=1 Tax=Arthroderma uncinatum TaxID=74035 RepID=UPI00144ACF61|nr:uncharacterized protein GIQ15_04070 [Arthroderma uncinatum]KAF3481311.1 hypothetical protein GIQ15_04070 [Arthroderma uncinatum]